MSLCAVSAAAADETQDACCGDLESRIAELEQSAALKGNRRMSLEVSGHVHRALLSWSDGHERNTYTIDPTNYGSFTMLSGEAEIANKLEAGFILSFDYPSNESFSLSQDVTQIPGTPVIGRQSIFLAHEQWGRIAIGRESEAHDHITESDNSETGLFAGPAVTDWNGSFLVRGPSSERLSPDDLSWTSLSSASTGDGDNANAVRYDTPAIAGFQMAVSWGESDVTAGAARYSFDNDAMELSVGAALAYYPHATRSPCIDLESVADCLTLGGSASVLHKSSHISVTAAGGLIASDPRDRQGALLNRDFWFYGKLAQEWTLTSLGGTVLYGEYFHGRHSGQIALDPDAGEDVDAADVSAVTEVFGAGVMQFFDDTELQVYAGWRVYSVTGQSQFGASSGLEALHLDDFQVFTAGSRISF